jgi:hypothetical protein
MEACMESREPTSVEIESVVVHEEVAKEKAVVKPVRALKKWYRDQRLAMRRCSQPKTQTMAVVGPGRSWLPPSEG